MEGEATDKETEPRDGSPSHSDEGIKQTSAVSPPSPHGQAVSDSGKEKFEVLTEDSEDAPTQEQSDNANCTIVPVQLTKTHVFRQEVSHMQESVTSVLSKITSPLILRAATNDDILVGMIRDIIGNLALLHEAMKHIEKISAEQGQVQVTTALEALTEQQRVTKEQTIKANDRLVELNALRTEMEALKLSSQQQVLKRDERIKELEQRQAAKEIELNTKVEGLENRIIWMDAKIKSHERDEEKIAKELSDKKAEIEKLEERHAKVTEMWKEKSLKICETMKLKDKEITQIHTEMGEITGEEIELEKLKKRIAVWHNNIQSLLESSNKIETIEADGLIGLQSAEKWKDSALSDLRAQLNILQSQIQQLTTEREYLTRECQAYKVASQTAGSYANAHDKIASAHSKIVDMVANNTRNRPAIDAQSRGNSGDETLALPAPPDRESSD